MNVDDFLKRDLNRRQFLGRSAQNAAGVAAGVVGVGLVGAAALAKEIVSDRLRIGVIGVRNHGKALATGFAALPNAQVVALCDVDDNVIPSAMQSVQQAQGTSPRIERDFRRLLDDPQVDAVVIATPDHWHALMTTMACEAGKDVFVETPATHHGAEGEWMLETARRTQRVVQVGLQQRYGAHFQSAIRLIHSGKLGKVASAKAWFVQKRQPLNASVSSEPPAGVDFNAWLGPATERAFAVHRFHYHWRWCWDYGSGDLGLWGSQLLDIARWGLNVSWPQRVAASGNSLVLHDAAETPDSMHVLFNCGDSNGGEQTISWEHRTWSNHAPEGRTAGVAFLCERGTLVVDRGGWKVYDCPEQLVSDSAEPSRSHLAEFVDAVKSRSTPIANLETGIISAGWCHLANQTFRLQRELVVDASGRPTDDVAMANWTPTYRAPWAFLA